MRGMGELEKPENLSFLGKILFELPQKNDGGGGSNRVKEGANKFQVTLQTDSQLVPLKN